MAKPNVFLIINYRQVLFLKIIYHILKTLMLIRENMRRESGNKLFTHIPYYKKQFTFIG